jgi:hypothetical protein
MKTARWIRVLMPRRHQIVFVGAFLAAILGGCILAADDASTTCANFDEFLAECTAGCSPTWDCESQYDLLDPVDQIALDDCSNCLAANAFEGVCSDCSVAGVGSCQLFMENLLGIDCW